MILSLGLAEDNNETSTGSSPPTILNGSAKNASWLRRLISKGLRGRVIDEINKQAGSSVKSSPRLGPHDSAHDMFLPDLCRVQAVLGLVISTELVALLFTLVRSDLGRFDWDYLALTSLFMQWVVLLSAALLCRMRRVAMEWPATRIAVSGMSIVMGIIFISALVGDLVKRTEPWQTHTPDLLFILHTLVIGSIVMGVVFRYFYLQYRWQQQQQAELQARIQALQARIRPHFLFNSMNSIASLIPSDPDAAEEAVLDLAELFRAALQNQNTLIPLARELEMCERYLRIEKLRLGERLHIEWIVEKLPEQAQIPPITIQPLIENAIYHGIQPVSEGGVVTVQAYAQGKVVYVLISNPLPDPNVRSEGQGNRMALSNIRSRFMAVFGETAVLKSSKSDTQYVVTVRIPIIGIGFGNGAEP